MTEQELQEIKDYFNRYKTLISDNRYNMELKLLDEVERVQKSEEIWKATAGEKERESERLRREYTLLCPIADLPVIESLKIEKQYMMEENERLRKELEEKDKKIERLYEMLEDA